MIIWYVQYVNNVGFKEKCDSAYHRDAMAHLLGATDFLEGVTDLYITGDHGPHFWSYDTVDWQSTIKDSYNVNLHVYGNCKYHGYGP